MRGYTFLSFDPNFVQDRRLVLHLQHVELERNLDPVQVRLVGRLEHKALSYNSLQATPACRGTWKSMMWRWVLAVQMLMSKVSTMGCRKYSVMA